MKKIYFLMWLLLSPSGMAGCGDSDDPEGPDSESATDSDSKTKLPIENITVTKSEKIPTVAIVEWPEDLGDIDKSDITEAFIEFGLGDTLTHKVPVAVDAKKMRSPVFGMRAGALTYSLRASITAADKTYTTEVVEFETGYAPTNFPLVTEEYRHASLPVEDGYILVTTFAAPVYVFIVDTEGYPVWWTEGIVAGKDDVGSSEAVMDWNGEHIYIVATNPTGEESPIRRVSLDGETVEDFEAGRAHHSLKSVPEGGVVFVQRTVDDQGNDTCDAIVHLSENGKLTEIFNWTDVFAFGSNCHSNYVGYDAETDAFYWSSRNYDTAAMVTRDKEVVWAVGRDEYQTVPSDEDFEMGELGDIIALHGLYVWNEGRDLLLFNNTANTDVVTNSTSKIWHYRFDSEFTSCQTEWMYSRPGAGSREAGGVELLPKGNTMITYSSDGVINQIAPDAKTVVHKLTFSVPVGYGHWMKSLYVSRDEK